MNLEWTECAKELPRYGLPVLLVWSSHVQDTVYYRDIGEFVDIHGDSDPMPESYPTHWLYFNEIRPPAE